MIAAQARAAPAAQAAADAPNVRRVLAVMTPADELEGDAPLDFSRRLNFMGDARTTDPLWELARTEPAVVRVRFDPLDTLQPFELPRDDPLAMYQVLEAFYLLGGWPAVDELFSAVFLSLVRALDATAHRLEVVDDFWRSEFAKRSGSASIHGPLVGYILEPSVSEPLFKSWPGGRAVWGKAMPIAGIFTGNADLIAPPSPTGRNPQIAARVFVDAFVAFDRARTQLIGRVIGVLRRIEREAIRQLRGALRDSRATIVRETLHYFKLDRVSVAGALRADGYLSFARVRQDDGSYALAPGPRALRQALRELLPAAKVVRVAQKDSSPSAGSDARALMSRVSRQALAQFQLELARRTVQSPVLSQFNALNVVEMVAVSDEALARVVHGILKRSWLANAALSEGKALEELARDLGGERPPQETLARRHGDKDAPMSVWHRTKYIERGAAAVIGEADDFAQRVFQDARAALKLADGAGTAAMGQAAGEMLVLGATEHFLPRLVPLMNVAAAAWHIYEDVSRFEEDHNGFYCALDPRDSLVPAPPSASGLALEIAQEAAFAALAFL